MAEKTFTYIRVAVQWATEIAVSLLCSVSSRINEIGESNNRLRVIPNYFPIFSTSAAESYQFNKTTGHVALLMSIRTQIQTAYCRFGVFIHVFDVTSDLVGCRPQLRVTTGYFWAYLFPQSSNIPASPSARHLSLWYLTIHTDKTDDEGFVRCTGPEWWVSDVFTKA